MIDERWQRLLSSPGALPALPEVLLRLRTGLYTLDTSVDQLCAELQCDPALVAEVLKWINSPIFGLAKKIESLKQAVVLLGLRRLRAIILSQSLGQCLATYESPAFKAWHWWDRSILMAVITTTLCQRIVPGLAEEGYLCALICDLGVLVMARFEPTYCDLLAAHPNVSAEELCTLEMEHYRINHAMLAGDVFEHWRLPPPIVQTVRNHHDVAVVDDVAAFFLPRAVYFAGLLSDCIILNHRADLCDRVIALAADQMYMSGHELGEFAHLCMDRYRSMASAMGHGDFASRRVPDPIAKIA